MGYLQIRFNGIDGYCIINETNEVVSYGAEYSLEKLINGEWANVLDETQPCVLIMNHLEPHLSKTYSFGFELKNGQYRLSKNIGFPTNDKVVCVNCELYVK